MKTSLSEDEDEYIDWRGRGVGKNVKREIGSRSFFKQLSDVGRKMVDGRLFQLEPQRRKTGKE